LAEVLTILALYGQDAGAFGRRGGRGQSSYPAYCPPMQYYYCPPMLYYCPPMPLYCPPVPNPNDGDDNDPDMPPAPAKVPDVPAIADDTEPEESPNLRLFNDTEMEPR
jgi:hypothetical protein